MPFFGVQRSAPSSAAKKADLEGSISPTRRAALEGLTNGFSAHDVASASGPPPAKRNRRSGPTNKPRSAGEAMDVDSHQNGALLPADAAARRDAPATLAPAAAGAAPRRASSELMDLDPETNAKHDPTHEIDASRFAQSANSSNPSRPTNGEFVDRDNNDADVSPTSHSAYQLPQPVPVVPTLDSGHSVGVQSDKVQDLGPEAIVLEAPGRDVTHVHWNPRDPTLLAAGGDALCRIWTLPTALASDPAKSGLASDLVSSPPPALAPLTPGSLPPSSLAPPAPAQGDDPAATPKSVASHICDLPEAVSQGAIVTALAWSDDGAKLAVALHPQDAARGTILIRSATGETLDELPGAQEWVLSLVWNPSGTLLLGAAHSSSTSDGNGTAGPGTPNGAATNGSSGGSALMVWDFATGRDIEMLHVPHTILSAAWTSARTLLVCGPGALHALAVGERDILVTQERVDGGGGGGPPRDWSRLAADSVSRTIAVAAEASGELGLLDADGAFCSTPAHDAQLTALAFQPLANPAALPADALRLLATAAIDGLVKLWDARQRLKLVRSLRLGTEAPVLGIAFSPDGYLLAAAGPDAVLFWNPEAGGPPRAAWSGKSAGAYGGQANGTGVHRQNGNANDEDVAMGEDGGGVEEVMSRCLSWDADGKRLALGWKDQVSTSTSSSPSNCFADLVTSRLPSSAFGGETAGATVASRRVFPISQ